MAIRTIRYDAPGSSDARGEVGCGRALDDADSRFEEPSWEPEPLHLPLEMPRRPEPRDEAPVERESRVIIIDLA